MWIGLTEKENDAIVESLLYKNVGIRDYSRAIEAKLKEKNTGLEQTEQEPVAWMYVSKQDEGILKLHKLGANIPKGWIEHPLYTAPLKPKLQPLTKEQIAQIDWKDGETLHDFARAIEKAHKIGDN